MKKHVLPTGVSHPAVFGRKLFPAIRETLTLPGHQRVLDPFAGTGWLLDGLAQEGFLPVGVEIEPEWAACSPLVICADSLKWMAGWDGEPFNAIVTSPTYGNRLADHHNASDPSLRRSYTHDLGRPLTEGNSGVLHWGAAYREFHAEAWRLAAGVLRPGGRFVLNIKDHVRRGDLQLVSHWHVAVLVGLGLVFNPGLSRSVGTGGLHAGANGETRKADELVLVFDKE